MKMYHIIDGVTGKKIVGESHSSPRAAKNALLVLTAHELKNDRVANYRTEPPVDWDPVADAIETFDLPQWAFDVLRKEGM